MGKAALGLRVERLSDGRRPGLRRSFLRNIIPALTLVVFIPAYPLAWVVQSLGLRGSASDRLAGTWVVDIRATGRGIRRSSAIPPSPA